MSEPNLILVGASVRAAAFSALRGGLRPWCVDLFADEDLRAHCPAQAIPAKDYPEGLLDLVARGPQVPWMYTGGLENRPALVEAISRIRPLWGNGAEVLRRVRDPAGVADRLRRAGLVVPEVRLRAEDVPRSGRWLSKPLDGAGGRGITLHTPGGRAPRGHKVYFQEFVEGIPCSGVFLGGRDGVLQATRQLIGEEWLHAAPFHYCGSVGPLSLPRLPSRALRRIGRVLATTFRLQGLFGVDCVLRDGTVCAVEVNPRYPASVEILEYTTAFPVLEMHRFVCDPTAPFPFPSRLRELLNLPPDPIPRCKGVAAVGKAILFARDSLVFPDEGPWTAVLREPPPITAIPPFADIPSAGQRIEKGRPVLTFFAEGGTPDECLEQLRQIAQDLDRRLFGR